MKKTEEKQSNPVFVIFIFLIVLLLFLAFPYIKSKNKKEITTPINNSTTTKKHTSDKIDSLSSYIQIGSGDTINFNGLNIKNPKVHNDVFSIDIFSEKDIDLSSLDYYVEFYYPKNKFLFRRLLKGNISSKEYKTINISDIDIDNDYYISISHIPTSYIPVKTFSTDESSISGFTCVKGAYTYEYDFSEDKLIRAAKKYKYVSSDLEELSEKLFEIKKEENSLNEQKGVTASVVESNKEFIYTIEINYLEKSENKIDPYFYEKDEFNYVVMFKMEAEGFDCK